MAARRCIEILAAMLGKQGTNYQIWRRYWRDKLKLPDFDTQLAKALHDGLWANTAAAAKNVSVKGDLKSVQAKPAGSGMEISFRPDPTILDGRFANNGWLQELPNPISKVVWDNAVFLAPSTAEKLAVTTDDVVVLKVGNNSIKGSVWVAPGQARDTATVHLGYGRSRAGKLGTNVGFNVNPLRTADNLWSAAVEISPANEHYKLVSTQTHHGIQQIKDADSAQKDRHIIRTGTEEDICQKA